MEGGLKMPYVFVYGSLKQGFGNNRLMLGSDFIGEAITCGKYAMMDLGWFPMLRNDMGRNTHVHGELYRVSRRVLRTLDRLEGHPHGGYRRHRIHVMTDEGKVRAWVYMGHREMYTKNVVPSGVWEKGRNRA
jgi:gamma-glutamylaminecyclotransferase